MQHTRSSNKGLHDSDSDLHASDSGLYASDTILHGYRQITNKPVIIIIVFLFSACVSMAQIVQPMAGEQDMEAYLLVYFRDNTHSLHFALSTDGNTFTALNDGNQVVGGDTIASQKGIRDPHIARGPDGAFCLAMTDLHLFAQRLGYRATRWERDEEKYDWGNNRGFVLRPYMIPGRER